MMSGARNIYAFFWLYHSTAIYNCTHLLLLLSILNQWKVKNYFCEGFVQSHSPPNEHNINFYFSKYDIYSLYCTAILYSPQFPLFARIFLIIREVKRIYTWCNNQPFHCGRIQKVRDARFVTIICYYLLRKIACQKWINALSKKSRSVNFKYTSKLRHSLSPSSSIQFSFSLVHFFG